MRSLLVLLLDGLGDRAHGAHGGRTANEAAHTPHLDALAARGSTGLLLPLGPGRAPSSELAHWAILGYRPSEFPGRAVFEARGHGHSPAADEVLAHAALRTAELRDGALWATGRAGSGDAGDARILLESIPRRRVSGLDLELRPLVPEKGEGVLMVTGGAHDAVTDSDPFFRDRHPILRPRPLVAEADATARAAELWSRATLRALARHPANAARRRRDRPPLTAVTLKWWGRPREAPTFRERHGLEGVLIAGSPFLAGVAATVGLRFVHSAEGDDPAAALRDRLDLARTALDDGATFAFCHLKATDEAGHSKDPHTKRKAIEAVDGALGRLGDRFADAVVCVTGDHATPTSPEVIHSGDPVPFLLAGPGVRADRVERFGELDCAGGLLGHLTGADVMPVLLNAADRPLFLGSRPTPVTSPAGSPADVEPLRP
jgi:2,3-bisphosphoglycerate-independent phosphoglycerate mutase